MTAPTPDEAAALVPHKAASLLVAAARIDPTLRTAAQDVQDALIALEGERDALRRDLAAAREDLEKATRLRLQLWDRLDKARAREAAARPVLDAVEEWRDGGHSLEELSALHEVLDTYRAALSAPVEAGEEADTSEPYVLCGDCRHCDPELYDGDDECGPDCHAGLVCEDKHDAPVEAGATEPAPGWREPEGGPNDGHSWRFEVTSRGSYGLVGNPDHRDVDHFDGPLRASVRAWSLSAACKVAAELALFEWIVDDEPPEVDAPSEPGYPRIADAIATACEVAALTLTASRDGNPVPEPYLTMARVLDKAGLIDWGGVGGAPAEPTGGHGDV